MKKVIVLVLVMLLAFVAFAEDVDLSNYNVKDLIILESRVHAELERRSHSDGYSPCADYLLGKLIPNPDDVFERSAVNRGSLFTNREERFWCQAGNVTRQEYEIYSQACIDWGFSNVIQIDGITFNALNDDNKELDISYFETSNNKGSMQIAIRIKED